LQHIKTAIKTDSLRLNLSHYHFVQHDWKTVPNR